MRYLSSLVWIVFSGTFAAAEEATFTCEYSTSWGVHFIKMYSSKDEYNLGVYFSNQPQCLEGVDRLQNLQKHPELLPIRFFGCYGAWTDPNAKLSPDRTYYLASYIVHGARVETIIINRFERKSSGFSGTNEDANTITACENAREKVAKMALEQQR